MSDAPAIAIAKLVEASLSAAVAGSELSLACEVERVYDTETDVRRLETLDKPLLSVLAADAEEDFHGRDRIDGEYRILVAVRRKVDSRAVTTIDPLVYLADEIKARFLARRLEATKTSPYCTKAVVRTLFSPKALGEDGVYFGAVELTFYGQTGVTR